MEAFELTRGIDVTIFPSKFQRMIESYATAFQCPNEFLIGPAYSAIGTVVGNKLKLFDGKFTNPPMTWMSIVAPSGSNKSEPLRAIFKPLNELEDRRNNEYDAQMKEWRRSDRKTPEPKMQQLLIQDTTPEARNEFLKNNSNGGTLLRDELSGFFEDRGRYNQSGEISTLTSIFDGDPIVINRKKEGVTRIPSPFLSIIGTIQPDRLNQILSRPLWDQGFCQRWLFIYPETISFPDRNDAVIPEDQETFWRDFINELSSYSFPERTTLSLEAQHCYTSFYNRLQKKKASAETSAVSSLYSKLQINCERWALITQIMCSLLDDGTNLIISPEVMEYSCQCMDYFAATGLMALETSIGTQAKGAQNLQDMITSLNIQKPIINKSKFAEGIGVSPQYVSQVLRRR